MKHAGKARRAGLKLISLTLFIPILAVAISVFASPALRPVARIIIVIWGLFAAFALSFFRDPDPAVPSNPKSIVSPGHGTVDVIDEMEESQFLGGRCKRVSIFLSVLNVHVQNAPIGGSIKFIKHTSGQFVNAMRADSGLHNENVMIGFDSTEKPGEKVSLRLIAGLIARRIVPWVALNDVVGKGDRISLIQFGSRVDLYLPLDCAIQVKLGDKVVGGTSVIALRS